MKQSKNQKRNAALAAVTAEMVAAGVKSRPLSSSIRRKGGERLTLYCVGDPHFGQLSWGQETQGRHANYDLAIARLAHLEGLGALIAQADPESAAILLLCGDNVHQDDQSNLTPASGHRLDSDARFGRIVETAFKTFAEMAGMVASRHGGDRTGLVVVAGNHDPSISIALRYYLGAATAEETAVFDTTGPYTALSFGATMLGFCHGHTAKPSQLPSLFANDHPAKWGSAEWRHIHTGHFHSHSVLERGGAYVETHSTLAAPDSYAHTQFRSDRAMRSIVYDRAAGEVERRVFRPSRAEWAALVQRAKREKAE